MAFLFAQFLTGLANAAALFLVASGLSLIFGVTRIVNFAHGSFYMLGAFIGVTLMEILPGHVGFWGAILLTGLAVGLIGALVEMIVLRPIYRAPELFQLVATFGAKLREVPANLFPHTNFCMPLFICSIYFFVTDVAFNFFIKT